MEKEIILAPEELFYLAKTCGGDHLNYDYIAMVQHVGKKAEVLFDRCMTALEEKGLVEDNWGEITVTDLTETLLSPIWNGSFDATAALVTLGEDMTEQTLYFHRLDGRIIMCSRQADGLHISQVTEEDLIGLALSLMPMGYEQRPMPEDAVINAADPKQMILLKNVWSDGHEARIEQFYLIDDRICRKLGDEGYQIIDAQTFLGLALTVLGGR